jgi:hypothetical protein
VLTASFWNTQVRDNMNTLVAAGTALPSSPGDGESFYYIADSTNGVVWHLRYRAAATGSYKWEFVGGGVMYSRDANARTTSSSTYQTTGSPTSPLVTLPLGGDYEMTFGAQRIASNSASANSMFLGLHVNNVVVAESNAQFATNGASAPSSYTYRHNGASATQGADVRYKSASSLSTTVENMFLVVRPIRVG